MHFVAAKMIEKKTVVQEEKHPCFSQLFFVKAPLLKIGEKIQISC